MIDFLPAFAFFFVESGSALGTKAGFLAIRFNKDSSFRIVGIIDQLCGFPSARFLR